MPYEYYATVTRVIDGDSIVASIDLGWNMMKLDTHIRLIDVDAPEIRTSDAEEKAAGYAAKDWIDEKLPVGTRIMVESKELDGFGRSLAKVYTLDENDQPLLCINDELLRSGHAEPYEG